MSLILNSLFVISVLSFELKEFNRVFTRVRLGSWTISIVCNGHGEYTRGYPISPVSKACRVL